MDAKDERMWAMLCHAAGFAGYISGIGFLIGPLIVWMMKRDESPLIDAQGKEALNFQISMMLYYLIGFVLVFVMIGVFILAALGIFHLIFMVIAVIDANRGVPVRYPLTIRFIR